MTSGIFFIGAMLKFIHDDIAGIKSDLEKTNAILIEHVSDHEIHFSTPKMTPPLPARRP